METISNDNIRDSFHNGKITLYKKNYRIDIFKSFK